MRPADPARQRLLESPHSGHSKSTLASSTGCPGFVRRFTNFGWPYVKLARIDGLLGVWLTFWPCAWGATLAAYHYSLPWLQLATVISFMFVGCALLHSAVCVWNDYVDREVDRLVERTKHRPLAAGIVSETGALIWTATLLAPFILELTLTNRFCMWVTLANLPFQFGYPFLKRITYWPSLFLGITFSWGSLSGWSAMTGELHPRISPILYLGGVCWAFAYDTIYGFQDKRDDPTAGVKSTAQVLGDNAKPFLYTLEVLFIVSLIYIGELCNSGPLYMIGVVGAAATHVLWQVTVVDLDDPNSCFKIFYSNSWIGWPIWIPLLGDYYFKVYYA